MEVKFKIRLGFYGVDHKKNTRLSDEDINRRIAKVFAEVDDEEDSDEQTSAPRLTTSGEIIPENIHVAQHWSKNDISGTRYVYDMCRIDAEYRVYIRYPIYVG